MMTLTQRELVSEISKLLLCVGQVPVVVTEPAGTCQGCHSCLVRNCGLGNDVVFLAKVCLRTIQWNPS